MCTCTPWCRWGTGTWSCTVTRNSLTYKPVAVKAKSVQAKSVQATTEKRCLQGSSFKQHFKWLPRWKHLCKKQRHWNLLWMLVKPQTQQDTANTAQQVEEKENWMIWFNLARAALMRMWFLKTQVISKYMFDVHTLKIYFPTPIKEFLKQKRSVKQSDSM